MKTRNEVGRHVDQLIQAEDLPPRPGLKPIRQFDQVHMPMDLSELGIQEEYPVTDEDEIRAWHDWLNWFCNPQDQALYSIKQPPKGKAFYTHWKAILASTTEAPGLSYPTTPPFKDCQAILFLTPCNYKFSF